MSGLYELSKEYLQLMEMAEEGELNQEELEEALLDLDDEIEIVAENCAKMIADLSGANDSLDTEIKRLQKRKARNSANMETIKKSLENSTTTVPSAFQTKKPENYVAHYYRTNNSTKMH